MNRIHCFVLLAIAILTSCSKDGSSVSTIVDEEKDALYGQWTVNQVIPMLDGKSSDSYTPSEASKKFNFNNILTDLSFYQNNVCVENSRSVYSYLYFPDSGILKYGHGSEYTITSLKEDILEIKENEYPSQNYAINTPEKMLEIGEYLGVKIYYHQEQMGHYYKKDGKFYSVYVYSTDEQKTIYVSSLSYKMHKEKN